MSAPSIMQQRRFMFIPKKRFWLLGSPVGKSPSPDMHNAAFKRIGLPHEYGLFETENVKEFVEAVLLTKTKTVATTTTATPADTPAATKTTTTPTTTPTSTAATTVTTAVTTTTAAPEAAASSPAVVTTTPATPDDFGDFGGCSVTIPHKQVGTAKSLKKSLLVSTEWSLLNPQTHFSSYLK
jgi:hypothetical protein